jgi:hypothetical protein
VGSSVWHSPRPRRRIVGITDEILKDLYDRSEGRLPDRPAVPELRRPHPRRTSAEKDLMDETTAREVGETDSGREGGIHD